MRPYWSIAVAAGVWTTVGISPVAHAQTPGYHFPGDSPPTPWSGVTALSADGQVAAGIYGSGVTYDPFVWSSSTGRFDLVSADAGARFSKPAALSSDGTVLAGTSSDQRAFRWTGPGTFTRLGTLPGHAFTAGNGISGDGAIVVGRAWSDQAVRGQAWRWTQAGGMQGLPYAFSGDFYSEANAISRDGNVIVGMSQGGGSQVAVAWTGGVVRVLAGPDGSIASGTNQDGSRIVGFSYAASGLRTAALWMGDTLQLLPVPTGPIIWRSWATDISDDGQVVLGTLDNNSAGTHPYIWTPASGWQIPDVYFAAQGFPVPEGWTVSTLTSLSADGRTFGGALVNGDPTQSRAFVLSIPAPPAVFVAGLVSAGLAKRRRGHPRVRWERPALLPDLLRVRRCECGP